MKESKEQIGGQVITDKFKQSVFAKTGGIIGTHEWWEVRGVDVVFRSYVKPNSKKDIVYHGILTDCFIHPVSRTLIGDIKTAKWYIKNNMLVDDKYPNGVAIILKKGIIYTGEEIEWTDIEGYYGYTHRGGQIFKIGDKLFDEKWTGGNSQSKLDNMSFAKRGSVTIKTWEQAEEAAHNMSLYLS